MKQFSSINKILDSSNNLQLEAEDRKELLNPMIDVIEKDTNGPLSTLPTIFSDV